MVVWDWRFVTCAMAPSTPPSSATRPSPLTRASAFSNAPRLAQSEGPQHVTVHGRDTVVVIAEEEFRRLKGEVTGAALVAAMQASPSRDVQIEPKRARMPVRTVDLL
ncbi:MAG TPA: hypothetical protein VJN18_00850 [Polyangiaceae bacterium]|nr:hypothetical protein [Polyangiaceae bacterium]